jgi:GTP 3',8-cyclase
LSSEGKFYTCLFATQGLDLRAPLRDGATDADLERIIRGAWNGRSDRYSEVRDEMRRAGPAADTAPAKKIEMYYIGG